MSEYPNLIHPVTVRIEQVDSSTTVYDEYTRAPVQQTERKTVVEVQGQASYGSSKDAGFEAGGLRENERGYVLFRKRDLDEASISLNVNDRIIKIGDVVHDAYITRIEPKGHYTRFGGKTLIKAHFGDRQPSKQPFRS